MQRRGGRCATVPSPFLCRLCETDTLRACGTLIFIAGGGAPDAETSRVQAVEVEVQVISGTHTQLSHSSSAY
jgi:hypothetical protein